MLETTINFLNSVSEISKENKGLFDLNEISNQLNLLSISLDKIKDFEREVRGGNEETFNVTYIDIKQHIHSSHHKNFLEKAIKNLYFIQILFDFANQMNKTDRVFRDQKKQLDKFINSLEKGFIAKVRDASEEIRFIKQFQEYKKEAINLFAQQYEFQIESYNLNDFENDEELESYFFEINEKKENQENLENRIFSLNMKVISENSGIRKEIKEDEILKRQYLEHQTEFLITLAKMYIQGNGQYRLKGHSPESSEFNLIFGNLFNIKDAKLQLKDQAHDFEYSNESKID